ncbi:MFS transporter, partial [Actinospica acidiphila]
GPEAFRQPERFDAAFDRAMLLCAGILVAGALLAAATVRRPAPGCRRPECRTHGSVAVPPLEADPRRGSSIA